MLDTTTPRFDDRINTALRRSLADTARRVLYQIGLEDRATLPLRK
ncbi:MAG: hypothetical protein U0X91_13040 [Spirosomataceae bacterium]